jgi:hypothetical protein
MSAQAILPKGKEARVTMYELASFTNYYTAGNDGSPAFSTQRGFSFETVLRKRGGASGAKNQQIFMRTFQK